MERRRPLHQRRTKVAKEVAPRGNGVGDQELPRLLVSTQQGQFKMTDDEEVVFNPRELHSKMLTGMEEYNNWQMMLAATSLAGLLINICSDDSEEKKATIKLAIEVLRYYSNMELELNEELELLKMSAAVDTVM